MFCLLHRVFILPQFLGASPPAGLHSHAMSQEPSPTPPPTSSLPRSEEQEQEEDEEAEVVIDLQVQDVRTFSEASTACTVLCVRSGGTPGPKRKRVPTSTQEEYLVTCPLGLPALCPALTYRGCKLAINSTEGSGPTKVCLLPSTHSCTTGWACGCEGVLTSRPRAGPSTAHLLTPSSARRQP